ncbi:hypothetical protein DTL42_15935 [Bremerella cremea]|uniref:Glycosyltransferase RgtA/B/C/D-like domain-containing protein n=1 Tax=Bremerella cremea TaxID=1031537 RepID=A0A368KT25_9BACT|nr:hypothetical protein [Bremerella cremea]RCS46446.1 hypothetical protein DTL42_15935 [Bremerella cremea]
MDSNNLPSKDTHELTSNDGLLRQPSFTQWILPLVMTILAAVLLALATPRIDFHADEAIYLSGVPVSTSNDTGLVYHGAYLATGLGDPTPLSARWASLGFGCLLIFSLTKILQKAVPSRPGLVAVIVPLSIAISYQGVFTILRVRPEISWVAVTSLACWCLAELRVQKSYLFGGLLLVALFALPMNHLLSVFPAFFLVVYLALFGRQHLGTLFAGCAVGMMGVGFIANRLIRGWITDSPVSIFPGGVGGQAKPSVNEFLKNVFWNSPHFLNDSSANTNLWDSLVTIPSVGSLSHCMIATLIWAIALPLPFLMRTWESRFVASIPLLTLVLFYASGYFNPTYSPIITIYAIAIFCMLAIDPTRHKAFRFVAAAIVLVTLVNGSSFLATRVFNHGPASFFEVESQLRNEIAQLPSDATIVIPERFQSAVGKSQNKSVLFKEPMPPHVDMLVIDSYDFDMYRFVPEYEQRRRAIDDFIAQQSPTSEFDFPVYRNERLRNETNNNNRFQAAQGSWFFRNSVKYIVSVFPGQDATAHTASRELDGTTSTPAKR